MAVSVLYLAQNVFLWGGEEAVIAVNDYVSPLLAIFAALFSLALWNATSWDKTSNLVWGSFSLGMALWTLAEIVWALYSFVQQEIPYPSAADVLWILGYPLLFFALLARYRGLRVRATRIQIFLVGLFTIASALFLFFLLFYPILQSLTSDYFAEGILASAYPLLDLPLVTLATLIALALAGGRFTAPWGWLAISFLLHTLSDIGFAYGTWTNTYYPNGALTNISIFVDFTYNLTYLFTFLGLYLQQDLTTEAQQNLEAIGEVQIERAYYVNILLFTDENNNIISVSHNFFKLTGQPENTSLRGQPVAVALELSDETFDEFKQTLLKQDQVVEWPLTLSHQEGISQKATLSGQATRNDRREFTGINLILRVHVAEDDIQTLDLEPEQKELAYAMLSTLGLEKSIAQQELKAYFYAEVKTLHSLLLTANGPQFANNFMGILNITAIQHNWPIIISGNTLVLPRGKQDLGAGDLLFLLDALRDYANKAVGPDIVKDALRNLQTRISANILDAAKQEKLLPNFPE